jgi:hypothetical protein
MTGHNRIPTVSPAAWWKFWRPDSGVIGIVLFLVACGAGLALALYGLEQLK